MFNKKWLQLARPNQIMPKGNWKIWMILAGRGFGKTRAAAEGVRELIHSEKYKRIALVANTIQEAKQVMVEGQSGLLSISEKEEKLTYIPTRRMLTWGNGAIATLYGAEHYEQLRGPQFDAVWVDEFAKFMYPRETFEQLSFSLRLGQNPKMILTTTPRPLKFIKDIMARPDTVTVRGSSLENLENLSPTFLEQLKYLKGTKLEAQEIYAEIVEDNPNTLWSWNDIENCYKAPPHFMDNIVIGVDPAVTSSEHSDETGIIVAGKDCNGKVYILEDASVNAPPDQWSDKVVQLYHKHHANKIVIETNAGGELLINLLQSKDPNLPIKPVRASKSKSERALPIVLLYQKKMVFHASQFRMLETQMATYEPGQKSPDRLDAMVWAVRELFSINDPSNLIPSVYVI